MFNSCKVYFYILDYNKYLTHAEDKLDDIQLECTCIIIFDIIKISRMHAISYLRLVSYEDDDVCPFRAKKKH